jgi:PPM family protein phosphatase
LTAQFKWGACSEIGLVRQVNEDSKLAQPPLFAVADGMGGHASGDVASAIAIEVFASELKKSDSIADAVHNANKAIFARAAKEPDLTGMGTTLTAMWADERSAQIAHVGDSRAYLLRDGELSRLTTDHTVVNRLVQQGRIMPEDADRHPQRSYLERALGVDPEVEVDVHVLDMAPGDRVLLCSDGLFGMIDDDLIQNVLEQESSPQRAAERLCEEAVHAGGNDNVTTVVVDFPNPDRNSGSERATASFVTAPVPPVRRADTDPVSSAGSTGRVQTMSAPRPPSTGSSPIRSSSTSGPQQSRGKKHLLAWFAVAIVVLGAAAFLARMSIKGSWYVGVDGGRVAVFNGIPGSLAGIELGELSTRTDLRSDALPELYQDRLEEGIKANSRTDARAIVADLEKLAPPPALEPQPPASEESPGPADQAGPTSA